MTTIGAVHLQGARTNLTTAHRKRESRNARSLGLRVGTLNVGTMTGKGGVLVDMMQRRKVDILCVQVEQ